MASTNKKSIASALIGNILEWYDFAIYGYFASAIGLAFFPKSDPTAQLLMAFSIFAVGYLMRPIGAIIFGHVGDKYGKKVALNLSVAAMAIPTFFVSILPDYNVWGVWAAYTLVLLRMIQGLSVGGEFTTSIIYLVSHAPKNRQSLMGATITCGAIGGILLGSFTGDLMNHLMSEETINAWGWRVPFLFGLVIGIVGLFLRRHLVDEVPAPTLKPPVLVVFQNHLPLLFNISGLVFLNAVGFYLIFVYLVTWFEVAEKFTPSLALNINSISMVILIGVVLLSGYFTDKVGKKLMLQITSILMLLFVVPLFYLMNHHDVNLAFLGQLGLTIILGSYLAPLNAFMVLSIPEAVRCTTIGLGYNLTLGVAGGLTPLAATWIFEKTGNPISPSYLILAASIITIFALYKNKSNIS
jgi:MHS family proline/betaine transporter-like MFS transporter